MRRLAFFAAAVSLCLALPVCAFAAQGGVWEIEELGITLTMPDDAYVLTREMEETDPALALLQSSREDTLAFLEENNDYLFAFAPDGRYDIYLTLEPERKSWVSLSACSPSEIAQAVDATRTNYIDEGMEVISCAAYESANASYIEILYNYTEDNYTSFILEYYTIYNSKGISLMFFSNTGEVKEAQQQVMRALVDEIRFNAGDPREVTKNTAGGGSTWSYVGAAIALGSAVLSVGLKQFARRRVDKKNRNASAPVSPAFVQEMPPAAYSARVDERLSRIGAQSGEAAHARCAACGGALEAGSAFCGACGAPTSPSKNEPGAGRTTP